MPCFAPGCTSGYRSETKIRKRYGLRGAGVSFFKPPKHMLNEWQAQIPRSDRLLTLKDSLCSLHFKPSDIEMYHTISDAHGNVLHHEKRRNARLKDGAIPVIFGNFLECPSKVVKKIPAEGTSPDDVDPNTPATKITIMPTCYVAGCTSGYSSTLKKLKESGERPPRFFSPPNEEMLAEWKLKVSRIDREMNMDSRICSKHFAPDDIELFFETKLPDGTIHKIPRGRAKLKRGAVPCIFDESITQKRKRKARSPRVSRINKKRARTRITRQKNKTTARNLAANEANELEPQIVSIKSEVPWDTDSSIGRCSPKYNTENANNYEPSSECAPNQFQEDDPGDDLEPSSECTVNQLQEDDPDDLETSSECIVYQLQEGDPDDLEPSSECTVNQLQEDDPDDLEPSSECTINQLQEADLDDLEPSSECTINQLQEADPDDFEPSNEYILYQLQESDPDDDLERSSECTVTQFEGADSAVLQSETARAPEPICARELFQSECREESNSVLENTDDVKPSRENDVNESKLCDAPALRNEIARKFEAICHKKLLLSKFRIQNNSSMGNDLEPGCEDDPPPLQNETAYEPMFDRQLLQEIKNQLCRLCGMKQEILLPIFNEDSPAEEDVLTLAKKIEMYLPLQIGNDEELPMNICLDCQNLVESWHELHVSSLAADSVLRKMFALDGNRFLLDASTLEPEDKRSKVDSITEEDNMQNYESPESPEDHVCGTIDPVTGECIPLSAVKRHRCRHCDEMFLTKGERLVHQKVCALEPVICHICGKNIPQRNNLRYHLTKVHGPKRFECEICSMKFITNFRLRCHMSIKHNGQAEPTNYCEPCCKVFRSALTYKNHSLIHKRKQVKGSDFKVSTIEEGDGHVSCVCPVCEKKFPNKLSLISHMNANTRKKCLRCNKLILSEKLALIHLCRDWSCSYCGMQFNTRISLDNHERSHDCQMVINCKTCGENFTSHSDMVSHLETEGHEDFFFSEAFEKQSMDFLTDELKGAMRSRNISKVKRCHIANDHQYVSSTDHKEPKKTEKSNSCSKTTRTISYKCKHCSETFPVKEDCMQHVSKCAMEPAFCDVCGKTITRRYLLKGHIRRAHRPKEKSWYMCEQCGKNFNSRKSLQSHIGVQHEKEPKEFCEPCCKLFYSKVSYQKHQRRHKDGTMKSLDLKFASLETESGTAYICPVCGEKFPDILSVILHLHVLKKRRCATCYDVIRNERHSLSHKCGHWSCPYCGRGFTMRTLFYNHVRSHSEKIAICKICGKKFSSSMSLRHHAAVHKPPRFQCDQCDKQFRWKEGYMIHKQVHEGVRYVCSECGKVFKLKGSLQTHYRKVHPFQRFSSDNRALFVEVT